MNMLRQLNRAMEYIEENIAGEIDGRELARVACVSQDSFVRFFSYMTGMTLAEYVRRRRLSRAGMELQAGDVRVIDVAVKYGYESVDAFSRAFCRQHGILPAAAKKGGALKLFPPATFHIMIKGAKEMNFRIVELEKTEILGVSAVFDRERYSSRESLRNQMWSEDGDDVAARICDGRWNQPGNHSFDGEWYAVWQDNQYFIGREASLVQRENLEKLTLPAGTYAAFATEKGCYAGEVMPQLWEEIFESWLPSSGYRLTGEHVIEVYHLWMEKEMRRENRYYEILVPVEKK